MKRIFFPGGPQGKGWWKLLVAAFELADRPVKTLNFESVNGRVSKWGHIEKVSHPKRPWKLSFPHPHYNVPN